MNKEEVKKLAEGAMSPGGELEKMGAVRDQLVADMLVVIQRLNAGMMDAGEEIRLFIERYGLEGDARRIVEEMFRVDASVTKALDRALRTERIGFE